MTQQLYRFPAVALLAAVAVPALAGTFKSITIDGDFADWAGVPLVDSDPADNPTGPDIGDVQIANDDTNLYIRYTMAGGDAAGTTVALDIDENVSTGFDIFSLGLIGSEAGWQNDFAFAQSTGVFNSGGLSGDYFGGGHALMAPFGPTTARELAISLDNMRSGSPTFPDDTLRLLLWHDGGAGDVSAVINYTLAAIPECTSLALAGIAGGAALIHSRKRRPAPIRGKAVS
jgi:hypothetical protein